MVELGKPLSQPAWWQLWKNPILARYSRSQLRPLTLMTWIAVVLVATAFAFFVVFLRDIAEGQPRALAANDAFFPVLVIQMVLLLLMGTGSVASGITREADDGMTAYMRLSPMRPLAKIVGYLFGLPIREYVLFACTLPFTAYCIAAGTIGLGRALDIYLILFVSAVLYHLTGYVAGTVVKNRRFAGRLAQLMVVLLYLVLPQFSEFGFVFFDYLTLRPVLIEQLGSVAMPSFSQVVGNASSVPSVLFFDFEFSRIQFSLLVQGTLVFTFLLVLYRKWRQETHHLLGKNYTVLLYAWILLVLVGNAVPMVAFNRDFFPNVFHTSSSLVDARAAFVVSSLFGLGILLLAFGFIAIITPDGDEYTKGLRRARKLGRARIPIGADGATASRYATLIAVVGALFWGYLLRELFSSPIIEPVPRHARVLELVPLALCPYILVYHGVLERFGRRSLLLFVLFAWVVPVLGGLILVAAEIQGLPIELGALSAFAAPFYLLTLPLTEGKHHGDTSALMQIGCKFSLFAHVLLAVYLQWSLRRHKRRVRGQVAGG